jgi:alpha-beta hydrolase superfamily lysophospholipase
MDKIPFQMSSKLLVQYKSYPNKMPKLQESWISNGNFKLYTRSWIPDENVVATVCFIHGLGEYCARGGYEDMFNEFAANGIKVTSFDVNS